MIQHYADYIIIILLTLAIVSHGVVAGAIALDVKEDSKRGGVVPKRSSVVNLFMVWKWGSIIEEVSTFGLTCAIVVHIAVCTTLHLHFFSNDIFLNGAQ